eukprot:TRINITY_DN2049_c0_g1_i1.p1 TRINITY_DN2049_c0_g1~~TRINITY_DN2049_c0_g1_i1.p1  ORF type:complete len:246 (-),score=43.39 TRINITY_DN2049_c0_g1_i1:39-776(-)
MAVSVDGLFAQFSSVLEEENKYREEIKVVTKEIESLARTLQSTIQLTHLRGADIPVICAKCTQVYPQIAQLFTKLKSFLKPEVYFKYRDHWKQSISNLVFVACFVHWLQYNTLLSIPEVEALFGLSWTYPANVTPSATPSNPPVGTFCVELEDYLFGLTFIPSELSRLCVNSVINEDFTLPLRISSFLNNLYGGFRLLNLKNDALRKRYDSIKYDVKKVEEVVYDLTIRGLLKKEAKETEMTPAP